MKTKVLAVLGIILMLSGCAASGTKFFIDNYESEPVSVQYKYYEKGQFADSPGFDYAPKSTVQVSKEIIPKKILRKYPFYNSKSHFDSLVVTPKAALTYQCQIPSNSTIYIAPIHKYGQSIEYLVLNDKDTIRFIPKLQTKLIEEKLAFYNNGLLGNPYFLVNLRLNEIEAFLINSNN
jgi:hypothetical protein